MAEVVILHAPRDVLMARAVATGLSEYRVVAVPVVGRRAHYSLGARMIRLVLWSLAASSPRVAPALTELIEEGIPAGLILCDDTPPPPELARRARATASLEWAANVSIEDNPPPLGVVAELVRQLVASERKTLSSDTRSESQLLLQRGMGTAVAIGALVLGAAAGGAGVAPPTLNERTNVGDDGSVEVAEEARVSLHVDVNAPRQVDERRVDERQMEERPMDETRSDGHLVGRPLSDIRDSEPLLVTALAIESSSLIDVVVAPPLDGKPRRPQMKPRMGEKAARSPLGEVE